MFFQETLSRTSRFVVHRAALVKTRANHLSRANAKIEITKYTKVSRSSLRCMNRKKLNFRTRRQFGNRNARKRGQLS